MNLRAGQIVLVEWRDALPRVPGKRRPAVVVEDDALFDDAYPNAILVPLAEDPHLAIEDLSLRITPSQENGCTKPCYALAHHVTEEGVKSCLFALFRTVSAATLNDAGLPRSAPSLTPRQPSSHYAAPVPDEYPATMPTGWPVRSASSSKAPGTT